MEIFCYQKFLEATNKAQAGNKQAQSALDNLKTQFPRTFTNYTQKYKHDLLENKILY